MIIHAIRPYSIVLEVDQQQALVIMEALNLASECPAHHELEYRMAMHGQHFIESGPLSHALQAVDLLSKALDIAPYTEDDLGDRAGDDQVEDGTTHTEEAKPAGKPN